MVGEGVDTLLSSWMPRPCLSPTLRLSSSPQVPSHKTRDRPNPNFLPQGQRPLSMTVAFCSALGALPGALGELLSHLQEGTASLDVIPSVLATRGQFGPALSLSLWKTWLARASVNSLCLGRELKLSPEANGK